MMPPSLPLEGEPDGHWIDFRHTGMGGFSAVVFDEDGMQVDVVRGHTFREAYDAVREEYPQAEWDESEEEQR
jgi:hypothetical protein